MTTLESTVHTRVYEGDAATIEISSILSNTIPDAEPVYNIDVTPKPLTLPLPTTECLGMDSLEAIKELAAALNDFIEKEEGGAGQ